MGRGTIGLRSARVSRLRRGLALIVALLAPSYASAGPFNLFDSHTETEEQRWLVYSGASVSRSSYYFYSGARASLSGSIDASGILIAGGGGTGSYRYASTVVPGGVVTGQFTIYELAAGYQHTEPAFGIALLGGVRREEHILSAPDPGNAVQGARTGAFGQADLWAKPDEDVLVTASASATSVFNGYHLRASVGHRVPLGADVFAGIEGALLGNRQYRETRIGLGLAGIDLGFTRLSAGGGWMHNRDSRDGGYGSLSAWGKF